ncbi:hypothetical protein C0J52_14699 [Blattella germanica]|nr:hypothetical protein C0J52_14699 [Blattella germanica]
MIRTKVPMIQIQASQPVPVAPVYQQVMQTNQSPVLFWQSTDNPLQLQQNHMNNYSLGPLMQQTQIQYPHQVFPVYTMQSVQSSLPKKQQHCATNIVQPTMIIPNDQNLENTNRQQIDKSNNCINGVNGNVSTQSVWPVLHQTFIQYPQQVLPRYDMQTAMVISPVNNMHTAMVTDEPNNNMQAIMGIGHTNYIQTGKAIDDTNNMQAVNIINQPNNLRMATGHINNMQSVTAIGDTNNMQTGENIDETNVVMASDHSNDIQTVTTDSPDNQKKIADIPEKKKRGKRNGKQKKISKKRTIQVNTKDKNVNTRKVFKCNVQGCGNYFRNITNLEAHLQWHKGIPGKPITCSIRRCGKHFSSKEELKIHSKTHINKKKYVCSICGNRFLQYGYLVDHEKTHIRTTSKKPIINVLKSFISIMPKNINTDPVLFATANNIQLNGPYENELQVNMSNSSNNGIPVIPNTSQYVGLHNTESQFNQLTAPKSGNTEQAVSKIVQNAQFMAPYTTDTQFNQSSASKNDNSELTLPENIQTDQFLGTYNTNSQFNESNASKCDNIDLVLVANSHNVQFVGSYNTKPQLNHSSEIVYTEL